MNYMCVNAVLLSKTVKLMFILLNHSHHDVTVTLSCISSCNILKKQINAFQKGKVMIMYDYVTLVVVDHITGSGMDAKGLACVNFAIKVSFVFHFHRCVKGYGWLLKG